MTNDIENTTKRDPLLQLFGLMVDKNPIERQEAEGQAQLVRSEVLPTDGLLTRRGEHSIAELWVPLGLVIGEPVKGDEMFTHVTLPPGWTKARTDHSMWSNVLDDKGRIRANIFYKAAFYDRSARINLAVRYQISRDYSDAMYTDDGGRKIRHVVTDSGKVIFQTAVVSDPGYETDEAYEIVRAQSAECRAALEAYDPLHGDIVRQWEK